ncbi:hypothetical protein M673_06112 [Aureimonas sp. AU20]|nr:hypothetical protein M673_06112 [Aureimonas sp. AU20]
MEGARAIAADIDLANGRQVRLAKVIDRHLAWFEAARRRGLGWDDIIEVLFVAGVKRANGTRLSRGHLSSLVWRKLKKEPDISPETNHGFKRRNCATARGPTPPQSTSVRQTEFFQTEAPKVSSKPVQFKGKPVTSRCQSPFVRTINHAIDAVNAKSGGPAAANEAATPPANPQTTLDYMRRAAALRRRREDE